MKAYIEKLIDSEGSESKRGISTFSDSSDSEDLS